jgi:hypothetical protein
MFSMQKFEEQFGKIDFDLHSKGATIVYGKRSGGIL